VVAPPCGCPSLWLPSLWLPSLWLPSLWLPLLVVAPPCGCPSLWLPLLVVAPLCGCPSLWLPLLVVAPPYFYEYLSMHSNQRGRASCANINTGPFKLKLIRHMGRHKILNKSGVQPSAANEGHCVDFFYQLSVITEKLSVITKRVL
jgi:hypothetical protein